MTQTKWYRGGKQSLKSHVVANWVFQDSPLSSDLNKIKETFKLVVCNNRKKARGCVKTVRGRLRQKAVECKLFITQNYSLAISVHRVIICRQNLTFHRWNCILWPHQGRYAKINKIWVFLLHVEIKILFSRIPSNSFSAKFVLK